MNDFHFSSILGANTGWHLAGKAIAFFCFFFWGGGAVRALAMYTEGNDLERGEAKRKKNRLK